jgi:hypothetical protein
MTFQTIPVVAMLTLASIASAQRTQHAPAPTSGAAAPRVATIAPTPVPPPQQVYPHRFYGHGGFRDDLPILLMADGRVFADFGRGFEQVVRSCALPTGFSSSQVVSPSGLQQPVVVQPTVTQPVAPGVERLPYTPPVPAQQTPSQQMATQGGQFAPQSLSNQTCWAVAQNGRIVVAQP